MIINKLTFSEIEKIITPILVLEEIEVVKKNIYEVFHLTNFNLNDKKQYFIKSNNDSIHSTYKGYEIEIRSLNDPNNGFYRAIIQFKIKPKFFDFFFNPNRRIINDLKRICKKEMTEISFGICDPGTSTESTKEELYCGSGFNPDWNEDFKLSPLQIFTRETGREYLIEFIFTSECYERESNKTVLKDNWLDIFKNYIPPL